MEYSNTESAADYWDDRVLRLEEAVRSLRIRFWAVLAGLVILALAAGTVAYVGVQMIEDDRDDITDLCQTIRELSDERHPCH